MNADDQAAAAARDIYSGQSVCIWARWFAIAGMLIAVLWNSNDAGALTSRIPIVIALIAVNFAMQGRILTERPANRLMITLTSLIDIGAVTAIVAGLGGEQGLASPYVVLYYPIVLAAALVLEPRRSAMLTGAALASYATICVAVDPNILGHAIDAKSLAMRLITLAASGGLGGFYWRIMRARRHAARRANQGSDGFPTLWYSDQALDAAIKR